MSMGLLVGGIALGAMGSKLARNYFSTEDDSKNPVADVQRKYGVTERIMANQSLLGHYNEKYLQKKMSSNSAMMMGSEKLQVQRSASLARTSSSAGERNLHADKVRQMTTPTINADATVAGA